MLILWSGGCDSTLLLAQMLEEHTDVRTISIVHPNVPNSRLEGAQIKARAAIVKRFATVVKRKWCHGTVTLAHSEEDGFQAEPPGEGGGLVQPNLWLGIAVAYLQPNEDLAVGWIKDDCSWHYMQHIQEAFAGHQKIAKRTGQLVTPLEWMKKAHVIADLKERKLYDLCWWCESPVIKNRKKTIVTEACGKCVPCNEHATALWQLENRKVYGEYDRSFHGQSADAFTKANDEIYKGKPV